MPSEFIPPGGTVKMTKAQVRKYVRDMQKKRAAAQKKLKKLIDSGELEKEKEEIAKLEEEIDNL